MAATLERGAAKAKAGGLLSDLTPHGLSAAQFESIAATVYGITGINLRAGKEELVKSRLVKRLRALDLDDFEQYLEYIKADISGREIATMVDLLTTNKTSFFRETKHFDFLRQWLRAHRGQKMRIWSAGCSSGEEPFSIAIVICEELPGTERGNVRVLATDISNRMLDRARHAVYGAQGVGDLPGGIVAKYFTCDRTGGERTYVVSEPARSLVKFAQLNLLGSWPMRGQFDLVFCRNVMIYFDIPTRKRVLAGIWQVLRPGGYLFVGHSESLLGSSKDFQYVQPAVYRKGIAKC